MPLAKHLPESLEERRFRLEKEQADRQDEHERARIEIDQEKATRDGRFFRNPGLLAAAIALASVIVSGAQVYANRMAHDDDTKLREREIQIKDREVSIKDKELEMSNLRIRQQNCSEDARRVVVQLDKSIVDPGQRQLMRQLLHFTCRDFEDSVSSTDADAGASTAAPPVGAVLAKDAVIAFGGGNPKLVAPGGWGNFSVVVRDAEGHPVEGAKVAWRTPDIDEQFTYIGTTDRNGVSTATNLYTRSSGQFTQEAQLVPTSTAVGFTQWNKLHPMGKAAQFKFAFGAP